MDEVHFKFDHGTDLRMRRRKNEERRSLLLTMSAKFSITRLHGTVGLALAKTPGLSVPVSR